VRRCGADGLTLDAYGRREHPAVVTQRLRTLGFYGDLRDTLEVQAFVKWLPPERVLDDAEWRRAYLARYMRIPPSEVDQMTLRESRGYVRRISELLEQEAGKRTSLTQLAQQSETDG